MEMRQNNRTKSSETVQIIVGGLSQIVSTLTTDDHSNLSWLIETKTGNNTSTNKPRRPRATQRERQRMAQVNNAFDNLRRIVPRGHMTEYQRLSKIATLRLAIQYIKAMSHVLGKSFHRRSKLDGSVTSNQTNISNRTMKYGNKINKLLVHAASGRTIRSRRNLGSMFNDDESFGQNHVSMMESNHEVNKTLMLFGYEPELPVDSKWENALSEQGCDPTKVNSTIPKPLRDYDSPHEPYFGTDMQFGSPLNNAEQINHISQTYQMESSHLSMYHCQWCDHQPHHEEQQTWDHLRQTYPQWSYLPGYNHCI